MSSTRWQYLVVQAKPNRWFKVFPDAEVLAELMNRHGAQGWELVGVAGAPPHAQHLLFKRPA
jgi:hypothetical protein